MSGFPVNQDYSRQHAPDTHHLNALPRKPPACPVRPLHDAGATGTLGRQGPGRNKPEGYTTSRRLASRAGPQSRQCNRNWPATQGTHGPHIAGPVPGCRQGPARAHRMRCRHSRIDSGSRRVSLPPTGRSGSRPLPHPYGRVIDGGNRPTPGGGPSPGPLRLQFAVASRTSVPCHQFSPSSFQPRTQECTPCSGQRPSSLR